MSFNPILQTVTPVFLIILVGFIIGKLKKLNINPLTDLVVYIAGPCLIFSAISRSDINLTDFTAIFTIAIAVILILALILFIILKLSRSKKLGLYLPISVGNTGYLGYPIALFAFGTAGLSRAVVYDMAGSLMLFSLGIYILTNKQGIKEVLKVPLVYSVIIGLLFSLLKLPVPDAIFKPIEMVGAITIPLALLLLGYKLTTIKINSIKIAMLASLMRIIGGFLVALILIKIFSITGLVKNIILLQSAMPSAVMSMILTTKYNKDSELVASIVFLSTVLSILSIPLILWFL
ncbi:MAG: AEC family transporter [Nanoarchaeota archaeon]|nr:AEC family transporter [Nanoarchaeota archaeon]MBU1004446.1 AEC family transporter [Nanoarchaeota archaeon]MBU1946667.1 AEC family transporter [Nanoarchaeota archaeon]